MINLSASPDLNAHFARRDVTPGLEHRLIAIRQPKIQTAQGRWCPPDNYKLRETEDFSVPHGVHAPVRLLI